MMSAPKRSIGPSTNSTTYPPLHSGQPVGSHQVEHKQIYPQPGWVEHDPLEIWVRVGRELLSECRLLFLDARTRV